MVFSSLLFLFLFLPAVLLLYLIAPKKGKNLVLFFMSLIFYAWGEPIYITLMLFSTVLDYTNGILVDKFLNEGKKKPAQIALLVSIVVNLGLLGFFKYSGLDLPLPIGISFYTFQTMSYTIDVYRRKVEVQKNIIDFGTYVTLFPQLIAGPIVRYETVAKELSHRTVTNGMIAEGIRQFLMGLGKKVLLANQIGSLWEHYQVQIGGELSVFGAWIGMSAFAFQIYFDFSGYSDMAIGLGKLFGFHFPENFHYPYEATSMTDFWRRWHMTLGTWFREYVYIPLGGNRQGIKKQIRNIAIVWLLTGIWHGASLNFMYWGIYFGVLLILEKLFYGSYLEKAPRVIRHLYGILLIWIGWAIFAIEDFSCYLGGVMNIEKEISLKNELHICKAYLSIIQLRYEDKMSYSIQIDKALEDLKIPSLTIQPLVENSVKYGCETKRGNTDISISVSATGESCIITVLDTGSGMSSDTLSALQKKLHMIRNEKQISSEETQLNNIGLANICRRLFLKYGSSADLTIRSSDAGTVVVVTLPVNK